MSSIDLAPADDLFRLPTDLKPTHYHLVIQTDLNDLSFHGAAVISLAVEVETSRIVLNASNLELGKVSLLVSLNESVEKWAIVSTSYDEVYERVTYELKDPLPVNVKATLTIHFSGDINDSRAGYYRSTWAHDGTVEYYSLTKFEAISARKAFPCWDEPLFKATFTVTMISAPDTVNLSNMPALADVVIGTEVGTLAALAPEVADILATGKTQKFRITTFETTPLMSTYIVAYSNGPFKFLETSVAMPLSGKMIPLRVYVTPDLIHQAQSKIPRAIPRYC
ncbi:hypothetical protein HYPSUDRAFT_73134 [Hypholoma sublateritium FD-334 SS-4]|uniref:Aminopeptidase N-like N-terminal domain-containing protein n=1 Tax=Hypholoma sublateritium (strain FD-334 SS-4) TaxID=945553 RepID=A0A0D2N1S0_HYPSF|nr:hypothetical protein HYPSUDRAFT_73134 [Hypholoma sublateritium FD-334 SS-4]